MKIPFLNGLTPYSYNVFTEWVWIMFFEALVISIELTVLIVFTGLYPTHKRSHTTRQKTILISQEESEENSLYLLWKVGAMAIVLGNILTALLGYWLYLSFLR